MRTAAIAAVAFAAGLAVAYHLRLWAEQTCCRVVAREAAERLGLG